MTISGVLRVLPLGATLAAESISFKGVELTSLSEAEMNAYRGTGIAFISQEPISSLNPAFTVGHQLAEAVRLHRKVGKSEARRMARELMTRVRLPEPDVVAKKYPHELSGGMAQRIAIARALAGEPELLIADEPTTALDVSVQSEILDLLRDLREQTGMALILVTHDWGVVAEACDRAMVMYAGRSRRDRRTFDHWSGDPEHPYTRGAAASPPQWVSSRAAAARHRRGRADAGVVADVAVGSPADASSSRTAAPRPRSILFPPATTQARAVSARTQRLQGAQ